MTDIIIFDQLADLKRLTADEAFLTLERRFQKERGRYLAKMLDEKTTPEETIAIKAVVNALESVSPMALAESTLKVEVANRKIKNPDMFKIRKRPATARSSI